MAKNDTEKLEILSGVIDPESKTYSFEKELSVEGKKQKGTFVARYMGIGARLKLGTIRAKLLDGAPIESVDTLTDDIAYMIAYLSVALVKKPRWFTFELLDEYDELKDLYFEVYNFMQSFREQNGKSTNAGNSENASSTPTVEGVQRTAIAAEQPSDSKS